MKKFLLLFGMICMLVVTQSLSWADDVKNGTDEQLRKGVIYEPNPFISNTSFPKPFNQPNAVNPITQPAISTGYYFVDSDDEAAERWRPNPEIVDTTFENNLWRRILQGPRIREPEYWTENPKEGLRFFRNPAYPVPDGDFFNGNTDSTDDAIAGPIPLEFDFYFNGIRYDSFYVSTNGIIALTNRRYLYDASGQKNATYDTCYDPMSMDWFARGRTGTGFSDLTPDDYGYTYSVLANNWSSPLAGLRARGGALDQSGFSSYRTAVIAPFFGDMHLSQFNPNNNQPEDWGKVYFKRSNNSDRLTVYFLNIAPKGGLSTPYGSYNGPVNGRPGDNNYIAASAQVVLNQKDSSVTIVYERFDGVAIVSGRGVPANTVFRYNTTVGVSGYARHRNYGQSTYNPSLIWAGEYIQTTHYFSAYANPQVVYPHNYLAIKFKQWKNTVRVVDLQYRVRKSDPNANLDFTVVVPSTKANDYELLAGEERIGAIQPVAILQNLTNNIQGPTGINYQPQQLVFRARFRIVNSASNRIVYNRLVPIDSTCLALPDSATQECTGDPYVKIRYSSVTQSSGNYTATPISFPGPNRYNGIPPYGFVQVYFPPFEPNEFVNNHIGRLKAYIIADPTNPVTKEDLADAWPFDDTANVRIYSMKRLVDFYDDVTQFHIVDRVPMPSTLKWVNIEAEVASGDEVSVNPLPPRGEYGATNNVDFSFVDPDYSTFRLQSPVVRMNRLTLQRLEPTPPMKGDELRSFPIDLRGRYGAVLSASFQRTAKQDDWPRGWCDQQLVGPEPRTVVNGDPLSQWTQLTAAASSPTGFSATDPSTWESIAIQLMQPSPDGVQYITNVDDKRWRVHPRRGGAAPITNMSAYALFGAGGYITGFLETDKDSALAVPGSGLYNGLRPDIFDDGIDFEYRKAFVAVPDTFIKAVNDGAKNFRFRIKVFAVNDKKCLTCIPDDDDPFFVDNVSILYPSEITDIEISAVKPLWPYTIAPATQAIKIPVRVKVSNNTSVNAPGFLIKVRIFRQGDYRSVYCRIEQLPFMKPGTIVEVAMPFWDARTSGPGKYRLVGTVSVPGGDLQPLNDTTYADITLQFGDVFAYDPAQNARNDVPDNAFTGIAGRGLNLFGFAEGARAAISYISSTYDENFYGAGYLGGSGSGQIAMKFQLYQADTIYGYQAFYGTLNQALDDIALALYTDQSQPGTIIPGSLIYRQRGYDDLRKDMFFDEYITYKLPKPVVLPAGNYWYAIAQLGETGIELAASKTRVGMRTTSVFVPPPITTVGNVGGSGYHLVIDKAFRKLNPSGSSINNNFFAIENTRGSGTWMQFMPTIGNPAYAHLHHFGLSPADLTTCTCSRGTWIPMIRPYTGPRSSGQDMTYQECDDDIPVELTYFDGQVREAGIDLFWETASEQNNSGFFVERKVGRSNDKWSQLGFVEGNGTSSSAVRYNYLDKEVAPSTTYQYRLRQVDRDGAMACESFSKIITLNTEDGQLVLEQNSPNPLTDNTNIKFRVPSTSNVKVEVLDLFGNVVKSLANSANAGWNQLNWNATDNSNNPVSNGTYMLRLTFGDQVKTAKMTVVR